MKQLKFLITTLSFTLGLFVLTVNKLHAQDKTIETVVYKLPKLTECNDCKVVIDKLFFGQRGLVSYTVTPSKKEIAITIQPSKTTVESFETLLISAGFDVNDKTGNAKAKVTLPTCCK